jgi:oligoendopeptidase F
MNNIAEITKKNRQFLPNDFQVTTWETIKPFYDTLLNAEIDTFEKFEAWLKNWSELEGVLSEELGWRYIRMTCDTTNEAHVNSYTYYIENIDPNISPLNDKLNRKFNESSFINQLGPEYRNLIRSIKKEIEIFREENIPLITEAKTLEQKYGAIAGGLSVEMDGKEYTMQQMSDFLRRPDRAIREKAYIKIAETRKTIAAELDELFSKLIKIRHQIALNAGFSNYRDYMFKSLGRFDYTPQDCFEFHQSIKEEIVPLLNTFAEKRKKDLGVEALKPFDMQVDPQNRTALKPFNGGADLLQKTTDCFFKLDTYTGECLTIMKEMGHLDLESRKGKAPGGYNYPLDEVGVPFIFMNATSSLRDMVTLLHEGGHAVHSFLTKDLALNAFKHTPSEVAELASMSMELITLDYWDIFFENKEDLKRAITEHLEGVLETLPWVATVDKFQHWVYENPNHTIAERHAKWEQIFDEFGLKAIDWSGFEANKKINWQKQLHIFEVPFYYVEYAMAQLGAIAVWKHYKENPEAGIADYKNALALGYTKTIPEIYQTAGIKFSFSKSYIKEMTDFVKAELEKVK